jgi:hypothetical protein
MLNFANSRISNVLGTPIFQWVVNQVTERSVRNSLDKRDTKNLIYLANKTAWFRVVSSIRTPKETYNKKPSSTYKYFEDLYQIKNEDDLAKKFVLFAGTSAYTSTNNSNFTYDLQKKPYGILGNQEVQDYGYRPFPGITSVQIDTQGKLGSIRSAQINFKVWDKQQLDVIDALYFKLGYTMFLEWGNTYYYKSDQNDLFKSEDYSIDPFSATLNTKEEIQLQIYKNVRNSEGNYDAMLGIVTNFNFTFNQEGGYDCTLKIQALGSLGDSIKINHPSNLPNIYLQEIKEYVKNDYETRKSERLAEEARNFAARTKEYSDAIDKIKAEPIKDLDLINLLTNYKKLDLTDRTQTLKINGPSDLQTSIVIPKGANAQLIEARLADYSSKNTILGSIKYAQKTAIAATVSRGKDIVYIKELNASSDTSNPTIKYLDPSSAFIKVKLDSSAINSTFSDVLENQNTKRRLLKLVPYKNIFDYILDTNKSLGYSSGNKTFPFSFRLAGSEKVKDTLEIYTEWDPTFYLDSINYDPNLESVEINLSLVSDPSQKLTISDVSLVKSITPLDGFDDKTLSSNAAALFEADKKARIDEQIKLKLEQQKQTDADQRITDDEVAPVDSSYIASQIKSSTDIQSALEIMLKGIQIRSLNQALNINNNRDVYQVDLTNQKFDEDLFSEGAFSSILKSIKDGVPTSDEEYSKPMSKDARFLAQAKYGFNYNLMAGIATPSQVPIVDFKELMKSYVLPYDNQSQVESGIEADHPVYIPFGLLLMMLNHTCLIYDQKNLKSEDKKSTPMVYIDFNPNTNFCLSNAKQLSTDINKFIIPFQGTSKDYSELFDDSVLDHTSKSEGDYKIAGKNIPIWKPETEDFISKKIPAFKYYVNSKPIDSTVSGPRSSIYQGRLMYCLINVSYVADLVQDYSTKDGSNSVYLKPFIEHILMDMNKSLGDFNLFRLSYSDPGNTFVIVDDQQVPVSTGELQATAANSSELPIFGKNSIVKSIEMRTDIGNKVNSLLAISANSTPDRQVGLSTDASSFGFVNTDFQDRYITVTTDMNGDSKDKKTNNEAERDSAEKFDKFVRSIYQYYNTFSNSAINSSTNYLMQKMSIIKNREPGSRSSAIVPVSLNISMDGLSGFQMTQLFTINDKFLPYNYLKLRDGNASTNIGFAIVGLTNTIENNQWTTSIRTNMAYLKDSPKDFEKVVRNKYAEIKAEEDLTNGISTPDTPSGISGAALNYPVVNTNYSNIKFASSDLGDPAKDRINPKLLKDINVAALNAKINVVITTAITNHKSTPRHNLGNAVDIAIIDGKAVSTAISDTVNKFVEELRRLGYVKNVEIGNPKAVLTFGFKDNGKLTHETHIHVSNNT